MMRAASSANSLSVVSSNALRYESGPNFLILNEIHTYRLEHDSGASGGQYRWYRDGALVSNGNYTASINLPLKVFGKTKSDGLWSMDVYSFEFISGFSNNPSYPADVFTGSGDRLIDSGGTNSGTIKALSGLNTMMAPAKVTRQRCQHSGRCSCIDRAASRGQCTTGVSVHWPIFGVSVGQSSSVRLICDTAFSVINQQHPARCGHHRVSDVAII